jgi:hypothetical protein
MLPTHEFWVVTRLKKGEDCVSRISDEIRTNKETLHVAVSTPICERNLDYQVLSENTL